VIRVHLEKFGGELVTALDIARHDLVRQPAFLEEDRHLLAVGRGPVVEINHRDSSFANR
jgi:hypothetical protein